MSPAALGLQFPRLRDFFETKRLLREKIWRAGQLKIDENLIINLGLPPTAQINRSELSLCSGTNAYRMSGASSCRRVPYERWGFRNSSGSFAKFAGIRRVSSRVSSLAADRRPEVEILNRLRCGRRCRMSACGT
jgi:hypothetical protein